MSGISEDILYSLSVLHINIVRNSVDASPARSQEEISAIKRLLDTLFELAAGAAVKNKYHKTVTESLVRVVEETKDKLDWNKLAPVTVLNKPF